MLPDIIASMLPDIIASIFSYIIASMFSYIIVSMLSYIIASTLPDIIASIKTTCHFLLRGFTSLNSPVVRSYILLVGLSLGCVGFDLALRFRFFRADNTLVFRSTDQVLGTLIKPPKHA